MASTSFEWFVARRYLTARRKQAFISLISGVSILGVGVGVMALVIALAIMTGVQGQLRDRILGSTAHMYVTKVAGGGIVDVDAEIRRLTTPEVIGASPVVIGFGLATSAHGESQPIQIRGIDPARELQVTDITGATKSGSIGAIDQRAPDALPGIMLGGDLASVLGVHVGDTLTVVSGESRLTPLGMVQNHHQYAVIGTVEFGFYEFDRMAGYVSIDEAGYLLNKPGPDLIQLKLANPDLAVALTRTLQERLGPAYQVQNWTDLNGPLYAALALEKMAISLTIGLIVMVAALNIVASLVLLVMEKSRDIAILRTMGAPARAIRRIFILQGLTIGCIGTFGGAVLGLIVCAVADKYQLIKLPGDVYQISYLPFTVHPLDVVVVIVAAVLVCFLATLYPSRQAGRLDPAEALRNQ